MSQPVIYLTTCSEEMTAEKLAAELVESNLAACVNVIAPVKSTYRWEGKVVTETEWLLVIKSTHERQGELHSCIRKLSGYELPEFVAFKITGGSPEYLTWLVGESAQSK